MNYKTKVIDSILENVKAKPSGAVYLNNRVPLLRSYWLIVAPWKLDVLKTNICPRRGASSTIGKLLAKHLHIGMFYLSS